ncbi:hypothetical protein Poli38472_014714 [Pythium oligandrum]|uniref:Uncharacterized protein n=1 Tax=Pythium oligandrum TaxID=41045 RepID=A0A8K1CJ56_PYTOL|nr:hypothetical protein Poli38472_014714 [Pythium oligandrum]|eukprot:TMW64009.1 hypothetical protein Poli38472_014714 [Pythium oligandrum]
MADTATSALLRESLKKMNEARDKITTTTRAEPVFSLTLLTKKKDILQSEKRKLEVSLQHKIDILYRLRRHYEQLLTSNGNVQERTRLHGGKIQEILFALEKMTPLASESLRTDGTMFDKQSESEGLDACSSKAALVEMALDQLKHHIERLELDSMTAEESHQRQVMNVISMKTQMSEGDEQLLMLNEEVFAMVELLERERRALKCADSCLGLMAQRYERSIIEVTQIEEDVQTLTLLQSDLIRSLETYREMSAEEAGQRRLSRSISRSELEQIDDLVNKAGPSCPDDEKLASVTSSLTEKLSLISNALRTTKVSRQEATIRLKGVMERLACAKSSLKSYEDQVKWLQNRHRHYAKECGETVTVQQMKKLEYDDFCEACATEMASIDFHMTSIKEATHNELERLRTFHENRASLNKELSEKRFKVQEHQKLADVMQSEIATSDLVTKLLVEENALRISSVGDQESRRARLASILDREVMLSEDAESSLQRLRVVVTEIDTNEKLLRLDLLKQSEHAEKQLVQVQEIISPLKDISCLEKTIVEKTTHQKSNEAAKKAELDKQLEADETQLHARYDELASKMRLRYQTAIKNAVLEYDNLVAVKEKQSVLTTTAVEKSGEASLQQYNEATNVNRVQHPAQISKNKARSVKTSRRRIITKRAQKAPQVGDGDRAQGDPALKVGDTPCDFGRLDGVTSKADTHFDSTHVPTTRKVRPPIKKQPQPKATKGRRASQTIDWFTDDSFSFT